MGCQVRLLRNLKVACRPSGEYSKDSASSPSMVPSGGPPLPGLTLNSLPMELPKGSLSCGTERVGSKLPTSKLIESGRVPPRLACFVVSTGFVIRPDLSGAPLVPPPPLLLDDPLSLPPHAASKTAA